MVANLVNTIYGPISADFAESTLGEVCVPDTGVQTGPFGSQLHASDYVEHGTPIITVEHLGDNRIIHTNLPRVSDEDKERLCKYALRPGDIVFSRVGSVDRRATVHSEEDGWLFSGRCLRIRPDKEKIDPGYLSWFFGLPGFQEYIRQIAVGATMPSLNTTILSDVAIYYPPSRKVQQAIASILGSLDDKIELNRRMNQTLEAMARAIFKSWFVDFDPVRAKAIGQQPTGLVPHIAELFPDSFEESELGEIPTGWSLGPIGEVVQEIRDTINPKEMESETPYIGLENMPRRSIALASWDAAVAITSGKLRFKQGNILFGKLRPYFHKVGIAPIDGICSTDIVVCRPKRNAWHGFILGHLSSNAFVQYADRASTGTKMPRTNWDYMSRYQVSLPAEKVVGMYSKVVSPIYERLRVAVHELHTLVALRDALLPELISGKICVRAPKL